jgi:hypothetical protein
MFEDKKTAEAGEYSDCKGIVSYGLSIHVLNEGDLANSIW